MMRPPNSLACCLLLVSIIISGTHANNKPDKDPQPPVFASNYQVKGVISLPYAELNEPFSAFYDKNLSRSRTDYYGDLYKVYQFGPKSAPKPAANEFGAIYKLVYVPANLKNSSLINRVASQMKNVVDSLAAHGRSSKTATRRACFGVHGSVGNTIEPQTVLPSLNDYKYKSTGHCPSRIGANIQYVDDDPEDYSASTKNRRQCELWQLVTKVGDKKNTYKFWLARDKNTGAPIPVHFYMFGYDSLLGSHYDHYEIMYHDFKSDAATDADFILETDNRRCESMPGPGDDSSSRERRSHMIVQNPIHEYVTEPHRYDHVDHEFDQFTKDHGKKYDQDAHKKKSWLNFLHNFRFINSKNRELKSYKLKVNRFADNDLQDMRYLRGSFHSKGYNGGLDYEKHHNLKGLDRARAAKLPDSWDWSIRGAVTPVKDQAVCGSCWSFGTSGSVEGAYFVKTGKLPRLSQQQMVDCSWKYGNNGCDGGEDFRAYQYIMNAGGLATEEDYGHYLGVDGKCHDNDTKKTVKLKGFYNVTANNPEALKHALINYGPVAVSIDASQPTFTFYSHGVYYDPKCNNSPDGLDHLVLVVGYTEIDGKFVWQVKNSWSTNWGDNGYILMSVENNNCGLMDAPTVPIIDA